MNRSACIEEVRRLLAAFPQSKAGSDTADVYIQALVALQYEGALHEAIDDLIASERWLPPVSLIRETYKRYRHKYLPPALTEPEISEEDRWANMKKLRAMSNHLAALAPSLRERGINDGEEHGDVFEECEHPDCKAVR